MERELPTEQAPEIIKNHRIPRLSSKESIFLSSCVVAAFLIRFFLIPRDSVINSDGIYYASLGKKLISGDLTGGISAYWAPLYSFFVGISSLFFDDLEFAGRFVSTVAGTLLVISAYLLIRRFYGYMPACIATFLIVIHPYLIKSSTWVMTESLYALILITIILLGWTALSNFRPRSFFTTGILIGAAYLTKPEALGFLGLFFILTIGAAFLRGGFSLRGLAMPYLMLFIGFAIFFFPYVTFVHQKTGIWTISQKLVSNVAAIEGDRGLLKLFDDGSTTMRDRLFLDVYTNSAPVANSPRIDLGQTETHRGEPYLNSLVSKTTSNLWRQARTYVVALLPLPFILFAIFGFFSRKWTRRRLFKELYLFSFVACTFIGYAVTVTELRYLFAISPILVGWVSFGIFRFSQLVSRNSARLLKSGRRIDPISIQITSLLILSVFLITRFTTQFKREDWKEVPFEEKQAGLWLRNNSDPQSQIMASNATVTFYAGGNHTFVPDEDFPTVLEYAKRKNIDYLIFSRRRLSYTPNAFPADEQNVPAELQIVYQDERVPNYKITIYKLLK